MSLTAAISSAVEAAFTSAGDLAKSVTYTRVTQGTTDVLSTIADTEANTTLTVIIYTRNDNPLFGMIADSAHTGELFCLIQNDDLSFVPSIDDYITYAGETYWIDRIRDHFGIVYEVTLARKR